MSTRIAAELELLRRVHPDVEHRADRSQIVFARWALPPGWPLQFVRLLVAVPPGYPTTPPDNFYVSPMLTLAGGQPPGNTGQTDLHGEPWQQFSYHVEDWRPHADIMAGHNLITFLEGVKRRLNEVS